MFVSPLVKSRAHSNLEVFSKVRILVMMSFCEDTAYLWAAYTGNSHQDGHYTDFLEPDVTLCQRSSKANLNARVARQL